MDLSNIYRGIIIVHPHGDMIVNGTKSIIVKSKKYLDCIDKKLLLIQNKQALGIIVINYIGSLDIQGFKKKFNQHRITEQERKKWWKNKRKLYQYNIDVNHIFRKPIHIDYPQGPQNFVKPENIKAMQSIYIGTSGYSYWSKYLSNQPESKSTSKSKSESNVLINYSSKYQTVELNTTFYRMPDDNLCKKLFNDTPRDFVFSIKVNISITHYGKLDNTHVSKFVDKLKILMPKIKCLLFQFPPTFKYNEKHMKKIKNLSSARNLYYAFEFRDISWYNEDVYSFFKSKKRWTIVLAYNCEDCFSSMNQGFNFNLKDFIYLSKFLYIRMHGTFGRYIGSHRPDIHWLVDFIRDSYDKGVKEVYVYFNNTDSIMLDKNNTPDALDNVDYMIKKLF